MTTTLHSPRLLLASALLACTFSVPGFDHAANAAPQVEVSMDSCFAGMAMQGAYPVVVTVQNHGAATRGAILVYRDTYGIPSRTYTYPMELPSGTVKRIIASPVLDESAGGIIAKFDGPGGGKAQEIAPTASLPYSGQNWQQVGMIGDEIGALQAARHNGLAGSRQVTVNDSYCKPEDAPDKASSYDALSKLVVGAGAERMTSDQWNAVEQWVMSGGSLILIGGSGSLSYLNLPELAAVCPLQNMSLGTLPVLSFPPAAGALHVPNVAVVQGSLAAGAWAQYRTAGSPIALERPYGAGTVTLLAFDPFAEPVRSSGGQAKLLSTLLDDEPRARISYSAGEFAVSSSGPRTARAGDTNPFRIHLPPFTTVAAILVTYFLLAVPVTYFVLRRIDRLEWAWISTPILSIAFAFIFYLFTADLYKAGLARRSSGEIALAAGSTSARFRGSTDMFFPRGGSYDIALDGADAMESTAPGQYDFYSAARGGDSLDTVDTPGGLVADSYSVTNLAFRRMYYAGSATLNGTVTCSAHLAGGILEGSVSNATGYPLSDAAVWVPDSDEWYTVGTLAPGETETLRPSRSVTRYSEERIRFEGGRRQTAEHAWLKLASPATAYLFAGTPGTAIGPQIGRDVSGSASVRVVVSFPLTTGGASKT